MPVRNLILVVYLLVPPACNLTEGWTPCQINSCRVYDHKPTIIQEYLGQTLVFMWNSAIREKFNFCFSVVFGIKTGH